MIFYGNNGKSEPISLEGKKEDEAEDKATYDVKYYVLFIMFAIHYVSAFTEITYTLNLAAI